MSEYVTVEPEPTADPDVMELYINQTLTHQPEEIYNNRDEGEEGSPIAQTLFLAVDGIETLTIRPDHLIIRRHTDIPWEMLIDDVRDVLRDFFL